MNKLALTGALLALATTHQSAASDNSLDLTRPSEADYAEAAKLIDPINASLVAGDGPKAFELAFKESPLFENIKPQIPNLNAQFNVMQQMYGPIVGCEKAERSFSGSLLIRYTYLCQHERFVSEWKYTLMKSTDGWLIGLLSFKDAS